jgi:hypothetical protein
MIIQQQEHVSKKHHSAAPITMEIVGGAAAGAVLGMVAGPRGMAFGAALGAVVGAAAGIALRDTEIRRERHDAQLDRDIGVFGGNLGEALPDQPPSRRGAFHAACVGLGGDGSGGSGQPSEGPMQNVDNP